MARTKRDTASLLAALADQRTMLSNAGCAFDDGAHAEAQNLAVRLRVLVHDGGPNTRSLLGQLGVKERLPYLDTSLAPPPPGVLRMDGGLCMISAKLNPDGGGSSHYKAPLEMPDGERDHPPLPFVDWWTDPIVTDSQGRSIGRRQFVLWLADQGGGAHVDPSVDETYAELSKSGLSTFAPPEGSDPRFRDLVAPSVRQIAYELERTLDEHLAIDPGADGGLTVKEPICSLSIHERIDVGRNDPCPCGSGLKRKKCFDLRGRKR